MNFTAPEVSVLIVDDNEINLEVTAGLLEPLQMKIDMADSGKRALQMAQKTRYHLIFMDHMMPVMDGVETTKRLRRLADEYYRTVPIIALTANALEDVGDEFRKAGMNDYLAKPIEPVAIYRCVLKWIPRKLIVIANERQSVSGKVVWPATGSAGAVSGRKENGDRGDGRNGADVTTPGRREGSEGAVAAGMTAGKTEKADGKSGQLPDLPGINAADGIKYTGSEKMWRKLLGDFYKLIDTKARKLEQCLSDGLIKDYTIEVHALKNTARMIGAAHLSEWFFRMEKCGKAGDVETITKETPGLIRELTSYKDILRPYGEENNRNKREVPTGELILQLTAIRDAIDRLDLDRVDEAMQLLEQYRIPESCSELMDVLRAAVADVKSKEVMDTADRMIAKLS